MKMQSESFIVVLLSVAEWKFYNAEFRKIYSQQLCRDNVNMRTTISMVTG
jgi:hypothetical protein